MVRHQGTENKDSLPWIELAQKLALWAWQRLAVRFDRYGGYRPLADRGKEYTAKDGTRKKLGTPLTHPQWQRDRGRVLLTRDVLARHFRGQAPEHVVGAHSTSADGRCLWGALDLDHHGPTSTAAAANLKAALHWYDVLAGLGFRPLLTDSNGQGGYHLRVLFAELVSAELVFRFLQWLTRDHAALGFPKRPETFPKQPRLAPDQVGNWLRLPGRHHTREHWSTVYDGKGNWLSGAEAAAFILALTGDSPSLIPAAAAQAEPVPRPVPKRWAARAHGRHSGRGGNLSRRIAAYAARLPNLGEGQGRTGIAFRFAAWLVRDMDIADDIALQWLEQWDRGNNPPLRGERLAEILADAHKYARNPRGCGREAEPVARPGPTQATSPAPPQYVFPTNRPGHYEIRFTIEVS